MAINHAKSRRAFAAQITLLAAICVAFAIGMVNSVRAVQGLIADDSIAKAQHFAEEVVAEPERLATVLKTGALAAADEPVIAAIANVSDVFRFRMFAPDGTLLLDFRAAAERAAATHEDGASDVVREVLAGGPLFLQHDGRGAPDRPHSYAEVYVPLLVDGVPVGVGNAFVDLTHEHARFGVKLYQLLLVPIVLGTLAIGCAVYTATLLRRQQRTRERIDHIARHDPLTGLANRSEFHAGLSEALSAHEAGGPAFALHVCDIDNFKTINDSLGHNVGDAALCVIAKRILDVSGDFMVARMGGDEFAVIQRNVKETAEVTRLARSIVENVRRIRDISGVPICPSLSIGVALCPAHAPDLESLQKCADVALYQAKSDGRDRFVMFAAGMDQRLRAQNRLRVMLRNALHTNAFVLHFQPMHDATNGRLTSFEALLRMPQEDGRFVPPGEFIPVAEEMGLTPRIGAWVLEHACRAAVAWPESVSVSVNLSPQQFQEDIVATVKEALAKSGLSASRLELEITESLFIRDPERVGKQLLALKALGARIAMDDFGTGYSSLSYLWQFPFDKVKVDRTCFQSLEEGENVREVLRTITAMSEAMNLRVTAEGIETEAQELFAREAGYSELQGFRYHRPMPLEEISRYIHVASLSDPWAAGTPSSPIGPARNENARTRIGSPPEGAVA